MAMKDIEHEKIVTSVREKLTDLGIETPATGHMSLVSSARRVHDAQTEMMKAIGLDLKDDSLRETPNRVAKMYTTEIFYGLDYSNFPRCTDIENKMRVDELIILRGIDVRSMCEHHFVPFIGQAHIGYIPSTRVIGLSKLNRIVDFFSRRPQVQERLTAQIHAALGVILDTDDVMVVIEASHMCMIMRGVKQDNTMTITSKVSERFRKNPALRQEFMSLIGK